MISLETLLRRELRATMLFISLGLSTILALALATAMIIEIRAERRFIESFVLETSKNVLIFEDPIILQRSVTEFWQAMAGRDSSLAGMNVYLGGAWVAEVGTRPRFAVAFERDFEAVSGDKLHLEILFSILPFLLRLGLAWAIVGICSFSIYVFRWRHVRASLQRLTSGIDGEVRRLHQLARSPDLQLDSTTVVANEFKLSEVAHLADAYNELVVKMRDLESLRRRQAAAEARELLAAQVAHDIRSPLGFLNIILLRPEKIEENAESVKKALSRLNEIAQDLLQDFKASGRPALETMPVGDLLREVIEEKRSEHSGVDFRIDEVKVSALGNRAEFKRLLSNLMNNSLEACAGGGVVSASCKSVGAGNVEIVIADNGPGMPPEVLARAGEKGFTYGKDTGNGLGLFSAKGMVEKWGGTFRVESAVGRGTKISMTLPQT